MIRIGLTGGIGSGKTTVAKIFEVLGIPVYYSDIVTRQLMNEDAELRKNITATFGEQSYTAAGLNRSYIASIVFNDAEKLEILNSLTHPATIRHARQWMQKQRSPYIIKEAALIFESGSVAELDYVIGVYAPLPLRIQRAMKRDGVSSEEVEKRMKRQIDEDIKMKLCDFVITNDENELITPQVISLHEQFLRLAGHS
ncbi:MAG TPA: dephospho-CoA kinase [Chitinophagaceae bacterium]